MDEPKFSRGEMFVPEDKTYGDNMRYNIGMIKNFMDVILPYAERACGGFIQDDKIVIAEFCAADGKVSASLMQKLIGVIREKTQQAEILVVYEDHIGNDYNALFRQVLKAQDSLSYNGVYVMASSTTMYKQCLPSNSTHFIFSAHGLYYLSKRLCKVTTSMYSVYAKPEEKLIYKKQAEEDWKLFLSMRSKELKPGGLMFIIPSNTDENVMLKQLDTVLSSLLDDNVISLKESHDIFISSYIRSKEELQKPFLEKAKEVKDLDLLYVDVVKQVVCSVSSETLGKEKATSIMEYVRTFTYNPIVENLNKDRTDTEKEKIANEFFRRYLEHFRRFTKDVCIEHIRLVIQKKL